MPAYASIFKTKVDSSELCSWKLIEPVGWVTGSKALGLYWYWPTVPTLYPQVGDVGLEI